MNQAPRDAGTNANGQEPALIALATRTELSPRVRLLLEGILSLCSNALERTVVATLDEVEAQLFKLAEHSRGNNEQQACFETLREIKRGRSDVAPRFMLAIEDALARFDGLKPLQDVVDSKPRRGAPPRQELTLVDTRDLEESLALQEFSARVEIRQSQALFELGHRFGVMAGAPAFDVEALPIGPAHLGAALQRAGTCLDIIPEHRVLLYHCFDRVAANAIGEFYVLVNNYLIEQRILRYLQMSPARVKGGADKGGVDKSGADKEHVAPVTPVRETDSPSKFGSSPEPVYAKPARTPAAMPAQTSMQPAPAATPASHTAPADERDSELFTTLRELLSGRRHALGVTSTAPADGYVPSGEDVQAVLSALQSKPIAPMTMGGKVVQRSVGHLKQDLLSHLRQLAPDGRAPQLAGEDTDTIDLVGMLFDYIMKNVRPDGSTQALMTKLQVPLLRVALRDKSFFTRRNHPARHLLNTIAETGSHWIDDSEGQADRDLVEKMQIVVDRVTREFDGNLNLFEDLLGDLSQHMHALARKAEMTERRNVDAARGREKLAVARERASNEVDARIATMRPGKLVRTLLEQAWTDVLALTLLRQGEDSEMYKKRLGVADRLLATGTGRSGDTGLPIALRQEIETGLGQVGYHKDDIQAVVKRLFQPNLALEEENPSSNTEIAIKLKSKVRLGDSGTDSEQAAQSKHGRKPLVPGSPEGRMFERLKTLPFGTWFEFCSNQQGDKVRRKLAWFSTLTGRCLFVNQRGVRSDERTLEQLAHDIVVGQASIIEAEQDSLVDRAWKAVVSSLKQLVGRDPVPVPA